MPAWTATQTFPDKTVYIIYYIVAGKLKVWRPFKSCYMPTQIRSSTPTVYSKGYGRLPGECTGGISDIRLYLQGDNNCVGMCLDVAAILPTAGSHKVLQLRYLLIQTGDVLMRDTQRETAYQITARGLIFHVIEVSWRILINTDINNPTGNFNINAN